MSQIAAMNISYQFFSFEYFLNSVNKIGFKNIDIWTGYPHLLLDEDYESKCSNIFAKCKEKGLHISNITPKVIGWPFNIADKNKKIRNKAIEYLKRGINAAIILEAPSIQLVSGTGLYDESKDEAWKRSRDSLREIADYAEEKGKQLYLEPIQIVESNLVCNKIDLRKMLEEVDSPILNAVVDTTHMEKNLESLDEYFDYLGKKIGFIHLNESDQLPWGEGNSPINVYLKQLNKYKYQGSITIEICSKMHYLNPDYAMKKTYNFIQDAISRQL